MVGMERADCSDLGQESSNKIKALVYNTLLRPILFYRCEP